MEPRGGGSPSNPERHTRHLLRAAAAESVPAQTGLSFDLSTVSGRLMRTIMAGLSEFERDLIRERVKSGLARAKAAIDKDGHFIIKTGKRRAKLGRKNGYRPSEKHAEQVLERHRDGLSYRPIARKLGLSKNTVMAIVQRANQPAVG